VYDSRPSWHNPRILTTLLLVFLCGGAAGALTVRLGLFGLASRPAATAAAGWKDPDRAATLARYKRELDLTPEQAAKIEEVLDDFMMYYQTLQSQMDEVRASGKQRILAVLNEEQRKKFDQMMTELRGRIR
jgi:Spy/CpxP family protein refolding chaperone